MIETVLSYVRENPERSLGYMAVIGGLVLAFMLADAARKK